MERCLDISVWNLSLLSSPLFSTPLFSSPLQHVSFLSFGCCHNLSIFLVNPLSTLSLIFLCCLSFAPPGYLWTSALWHPWYSWCGNHVWPQKELFSHRGQRPSGSLHCVTWARYRSHTYRHSHTHTQMPPNSTPCLHLTSHARWVSGPEWTAQI